MPFFYGAALLALLLDQASKWWVRATLPFGASVDVWPGVFHFEHVRNFGAAWGILSGQTTLLIVFTLLVTAMMLFCAREVAARGRMAATGFGLMLGGALGNLIDRVTQGYVTDFIDFDTSVEWIANFPVFNIADSALTVGVTLFILSMLPARKGASSEDEK